MGEEGLGTIRQRARCCACLCIKLQAPLGCDDDNHGEGLLVWPRSERRVLRVWQMYVWEVWQHGSSRKSWDMEVHTYLTNSSIHNR